MNRSITDALKDELAHDVLARLGAPDPAVDDDHDLIPDGTATFALEIAADIEGTQYAGAGRSPQTLAAATLYLAGRATGASLSQDAIARRFGCARKSIRANYANVAAVWLAATDDQLAREATRDPEFDYQDPHRLTALEKRWELACLAENADSWVDIGVGGNADGRRGASGTANGGASE